MREEPKDVVDRFREVVHRAENLDAIDDLFAPSYVLHDLSSRRDNNLADLKRIISEVHAQLPGTNITVEDQISAEGGQVVTRFTVHFPRQDGTSSGSAETTTGFSGIGISRVSGGKIAESWVNWEALRAEQEITPRAQGEDPRWWWPPWRR